MADAKIATTTLKPCPCKKCKNKNPIVEWKHGYWAVWCDICFASTPYCETKEKAIEVWNRVWNRRANDGK